MNIRSCEEYVVSEVIRLKEDLERYQNLVKEYSDDPRKFNHGDFCSIKIEEGNFYSGSTIYRSDMGELCDKFGREKLEEALTNDETLEDLGKVFLSWHKGIEVNCMDYDLMLVGKKSLYVITNFDSERSSPSIYKIDDIDYSLEEEVIHNNIKEKFRENIEDFLKSNEKED